MLHFVDIYLRVKNPRTLRNIHECEHKIFSIPDLARIHDGITAKTNGMSYARGIRFSLASNNPEKIAAFKNFFANLDAYFLPEWSEAEKLRFEAEESEWEAHQREYFGSFAASLWEKAFDKINKIPDKIFPPGEKISDFFEGMRVCQDFQFFQIILFLQKIGFSQKYKKPFFGKKRVRWFV